MSQPLSGKLLKLREYYLSVAPPDNFSEDIAGCMEDALALQHLIAELENALAHRDRALEWACDRLGEEALTCPDAPFDGCHAPDDYDCAGHWREAALAATAEEE